MKKVAYDIFTGKTTARDWSRGDTSASSSGGTVMGNWLKDKLASMATSQVPWKPILVVASILAGLFVFPKLLGAMGRKADARRTKDEFSREWPDEPTVELTSHGKFRESARALLAKKDAA